MRRTEIVCLVLVALSVAVGIFFYPRMPAEMASHWNYLGEVDGYIPKFWGIFLMPMISAVMLLLFMLLPRIDPLKANVAKFRNYFDNFILLMMLFMLYLYGLTLAWNLGARFGMITLLTPAFAALFYYAGVMMENAKRNWFIGIKTPWTLSSDKVWDKTHKLGGKLFKIVGLISLFGAVFQRYAIAIVIIPVLAASLWLVIYSYIEYRKEKRK